ncbi:MAG: DnaA/Hda family protein, partial [Rhodospirillaceae bacterium]
REDFLVAPGNQEAVAFIDRWPGWPGHALAVFGPSGCGKSHLAHVFALRAGARFLKPEDVEMPQVPVLLERNQNFIVEAANEVSDNRALLHLFNAVKEREGSILFTARDAPAHWDVGLPDLRSRLVALQAVRISSPDDAMIEAVLIKLFADRQLSIAPEVVKYVVRHMDRSFAAVRRVVELADAESLAGQQAITVPLIKKVLKAFGDGAMSNPENGA